MIYPWQTALWATLQRAREGDHLPHALLFQGEDGCGNEAFVQDLAQSLLCLNPTAAGHACQQCRSCHVLASQAHPDFMPVMLHEDRQAILVEQIRELNHFLGLSRSYSPRRVVIISPAERMNINAANSLLKSLEEPAADTHILLLSTHPGSLLPTIRSRCQQMRLPVPDSNAALQWLQQQTLQHPPEALLLAARGKPLTAFDLDSSETLGHYKEWLRHISECAQGQGSITAKSAQWEKFDKTLLLDWQLDAVNSLLKQALIADSAGLPSELQSLGGAINKQRLWEIHTKLLAMKALAVHPLNPRLLIEDMLMLWQARY